MTLPHEVESIARHVETITRMRGGRLVALTISLRSGMDVVRFRDQLLVRLATFALGAEGLSIVENGRDVQVLALEYAR